MPRFDDETYEPPVRAEDVLDGQELADYRAQKAAAAHARTCRDPFCERCHAPAEPDLEEEPPEGHPATWDLRSWISELKRETAFETSPEDVISGLPILNESHESVDDGTSSASRLHDALESSRDDVVDILVFVDDVTSGDAYSDVPMDAQTMQALARVRTTGAALADALASLSGLIRGKFTP